MLSPADAAVRHRRLVRALAAILVLVSVVAGIGVLATWPSGQAPTTNLVTDNEVDYPSATVTGTSLRTCDGTEEDRLPDGTIPESITCLLVAARVTSGAASGRDVEVWATPGLTASQLSPGTRIVLEHYPAADGAAESWAWRDFQRSIPLGLLVAVFAVMTALVAGWRGLRALLGLAVAFAVIGLYMLPALVDGRSGLVVGLSGSALIIVVVLFGAHGFSVRTASAMLGTLAGLLLTALLGIAGATAARLTSVNSEETYRLATLLGDDGAASLHSIFVCGLVLAGLGVLNDVTVTQASAVWELRDADPTATRSELFAGAMRIGRDHIASAIYTIAFAYAGAALPVLILIQLYDLPLGLTLTSGEFPAEIVRTVVSSIGLVLAVPVTTLIAVGAAALTENSSRASSAVPLDTAPDAG